MCASELGRHDICRLLLKKGANADSVNPANGFTSLHYASQSGRVKVIRELLAFKASKSIFTRNGLKPVDLAIEYQHQPILYSQGLSPYSATSCI
jgi:ankyrin repeat protein